MYLLFDIGGTKMRLAVSRDGRTFGEPKKIETPADGFEAGMHAFAEVVRDLTGGEKITAAAGGIAGPLDRARTRLVNAPNIAGWNNKPLKKKLEEICAAPVYLENDTAIVGLGEAVAGAARGYEIAVYITVSTGVGGVRIVDGAIDKSAMGFEIGHQIINYNDAETPCAHCGRSGHLEGYISGSAFLRRFGKKPYDITDEAVWVRAARLLAYGLNNSIVHWSPDVIVLGGSMITGDPAISLENVQKHLQETVAIFPELPILKKAELGDIGGLYGALAFLNGIT